MKKALLLCALSAATLALASTPALADSFNFSFNGLLFSGSGTFDASPLSTGEYQITGVSGSVNDNGPDSTDITGLVAVTPGENDNILYYPGGDSLSGSDFFDLGGVSFSLANGDNVNLNTGIVFIFPFDFATGSNGDGSVSEVITECVSPAPTPEPSSLALLGTAILGAAGVLRRRFNA